MKAVQGFYRTDYKTSSKGIKEGQYIMFMDGKLNIVNMANLPKSILEFSTITNKIPKEFLLKFEKLN